MLTSSNLHAHLFACFQTAQKVKFIQLLTSQDDRFPKLGPVNQQRVGLSCLQDLLCLFYVTWTSNKELIKLTQPKKAHVMQQLKVWKVLYIFCKARFRVRGTRYSLSTVGRPHETASAPSIWSSVRRPGPDQMHRRLLSHQLLRCTVSRQGGKPAFWMTAPSKRRQDDRWQQSLHSHRNRRVFWNVYVRVIKCLFIISKKLSMSLSGMSWGTTAGKWLWTNMHVRLCSSGSHTQPRTHTHTHSQMAEEFSRGFDMQIGCWLVISAGCNTVLSFLQPNIRDDNIYLKGAVDW